MNQDLSFFENTVDPDHLVNLDLFLFEKSVDPDQLASDKAIWSGSTCFFTLTENIYAYSWNAES